MKEVNSVQDKIQNSSEAGNDTFKPRWYKENVRIHKDYIPNMIGER